jgi:pantoate--beta-alanine ligase
VKILHTVSELRNLLKSHGRQIGFVPTMGALHPGHISLIERAKSENQLVVCSIFVNPTQFNNPEDLQKYPKTLQSDCDLLAAAGCDIVFAPSVEEIYPNLPQLSMNFGNLETVMEGKFRKGHFNGVGIVVSKLFHIVNPDKAYFGLKDLQQVAVIRRLVNELNFNTEVVPCSTVREKDGLAMSSRNARLSPEARQLAPQIYLALEKAKKDLINGLSVSETNENLNRHFLSFPQFELEYFEVVDFDNLEAVDQKCGDGQTAICIATYLDGVRLIDNLVF